MVRVEFVEGLVHSPAQQGQNRYPRQKSLCTYTRDLTPEHHMISRSVPKIQHLLKRPPPLTLVSVATPHGKTSSTARGPPHRAHLFEYRPTETKNPRPATTNKIGDKRPFANGRAWKVPLECAGSDEAPFQQYQRSHEAPELSPRRSRELRNPHQLQGHTRKLHAPPRSCSSRLIRARTAHAMELPVERAEGRGTGNAERGTGTTSMPCPCLAPPPPPLETSHLALMHAL